MFRKNSLTQIFLSVILIFSFSDVSLAEESVEDLLAEELSELGIEDLINMTVTSVSKKEERLSEAAAAVFVITAEDIRRSGATSVPELLRMAPGLHVARINGTQWAITSRGFNGAFATKLLVLIDGRSVYTPIFSGVFWDSKDVMLEDIARIEVIRGPGATLYGANAVNGVISIITKESALTEGNVASLSFGTEEKFSATARHGADLGERGSYRVYAKYFSRDETELKAGGDSYDAWEQVQAGFRSDFSLDEKSILTVQGDAYYGEFGNNFNIVDSNVDGFLRNLEADRETNGQNILLRYTKSLDTDSEASFQFYYDRVDRNDIVVDAQIDTFDFDFQHRFSPFEKNELVWGLRYRFYSDKLKAGEAVSFSEESRDVDLFSVFLQDEIRVSEKFRVIIGSKFEDNEFTGFEYQPSLKAVWTPSTSQGIGEETIWAAVSRSVRTPSRVNQDVILPVSVAELPDDRLVEDTLVGDRGVESENVNFFELGFRKRFSPELSLDIAGFHSELEDGVSFEPSLLPELDPSSGRLVRPIRTANFLEGSTTGLEVLVDYRATDWLKFVASYSLVTMDLELAEESRDPISLAEEEQTAENQALLRSVIDLPEDVELDLALRYVDEVKAFNVDDYFELDLRLGWSPFMDLELALVGQNLLDSSHQEYLTDFLNQPASELERGVYFTAKYSF